jgi:multiple sugar transport system permease protein
MVAGIFSFLLSWNDFMMSLVLAGSAVKTAPLVVNGFMTGFGPEWGNMAAASLVILLPVFLLSFSLQKHIIGGLTDGGVKS